MDRSSLIGQPVITLWYSRANRSKVALIKTLSENHCFGARCAVASMSGWVARVSTAAPQVGDRWPQTVGGFAQQSVTLAQRCQFLGDVVEGDHVTGG